MIRAVGANNANDRISFVRDDIDNLLVTNRTPRAADFYTDQGSRTCGVPLGYSQTYRFWCTLNNVFNENISAWLTMGGLKGKGIQSVFPSDYQLMPFTATNPQISPLGYP
jgi:hypothetical protein